MAEQSRSGRGCLTVREWLTVLEERFTAAGVPTPRVDAELLLRHVLDWPRVRVLTSGRVQVDKAAGARLAELAARRVAREPLQLLVGTVGFRHLELHVRPGVFIPRPETEVLAGEAIDRTPRGGIVVEPCTGTGAVACAVADEAAPGRVHATDVSADAVALADENAQLAGVDVQVARGDLLDPVPHTLRGRIDVLVANPPYLAEGELEQLEPEVAGWDPPAALVAGPTGHEVSDRLITLGREWLASGAWLLLEVDAARAKVVAGRCRAAGFEATGVSSDLTGRERIVQARQP